MKKYFLGLLILISFFANGQYKAEVFEAALLEAKYGALLLYNGQTNSFSVRFESTSFKPTEQPNFIIVDNILMQCSVMPFTQQLDFANMDSETKKSI